MNCTGVFKKSFWDIGVTFFLKVSVTFFLFFQRKIPLSDRKLGFDTLLFYCLFYDSILNLLKINRRRLLREMFSSQKIRADVLPFMARMVATLAPVMPDFPTELSKMLIEQFRLVV